MPDEELQSREVHLTPLQVEAIEVLSRGVGLSEEDLLDQAVFMLLMTCCHGDVFLTAGDEWQKWSNEHREELGWAPETAYDLTPADLLPGIDDA